MTPRMDDGVWQTEDISLLLIPETVLICSDNQDNDEDDDEEDDEDDQGNDDDDDEGKDGDDDDCISVNTWIKRPSPKPDTAVADDGQEGNKVGGWGW